MSKAEGNWSEFGNWGGKNVFMSQKYHPKRDDFVYLKNLTTLRYHKNGPLNLNVGKYIHTMGPHMGYKLDV